VPGKTCPWCTNRTFARVRKNNKDKAHSKCSKCGGIGWVKKPAGTGGGSGKECGQCGQRKLHTIRKGTELTILYCSNIACTSVVVFKGRPPARS
jgi:hypothetical protein